MALCGCPERCYQAICRSKNSLMNYSCKRRICKVAVCGSLSIAVAAACGLLWLANFGVWHSQSTIVLYSAHEQMHDGRLVITVIGVAERDSLRFTSFTCRLSAGNAVTGWYDQTSLWETLATAHELPEHNDEKIGAIYIHCPISPGRKRPDFVSVMVNGTDPYHHTVRVTSPEVGPPRWQMALCVPPIHSSYNDWHQVVETLELLQIVGVEKAVIYTVDVGSDVTSVLNYYVMSGFLRLHAWPVLPQPIHYFGQMAAINDCLLRMRNVARLVMFSDLDEVIMPHHHRTLPDLLKDVLKEQKDPDHVAAFNFLNAFYVSSNDSESQTRVLELNTASLSSDQLRLAQSLEIKAVSRLYHGKIFNYMERSKCIVDPLKVTLMQIHFARKFAEGFTSVTVNTSLALLHHYRVVVKRDNLIAETSALQFASELIQRVSSVRTALGFLTNVSKQTKPTEWTTT